MLNSRIIQLLLNKKPRLVQYLRLLLVVVYCTSSGQCGVVWCGVVWCAFGVVWCGVVWCSVVW